MRNGLLLLRRAVRRLFWIRFWVQWRRLIVLGWEYRRVASSVMTISFVDKVTAWSFIRHTKTLTLRLILLRGRSWGIPSTLWELCGGLRWCTVI